MPVDREKVLRTAQKLVDKKRYDKAIAEYQQLVAEDPTDVRTLLKIGDLYLKLDDHEHAVATYERVGEHYYRDGSSVKAIAVYKQIRGIIRRYAPALEGRYGHIAPRLAEIYTQLGLTGDALAAYDEVAAQLRKDGRERDALDVFKKVVELDPQNPFAHLRVAESRAKLGDIDRAVARFGEAARILLKSGRTDDAIKVLERLLQLRLDAEYARVAAQLYLARAGPQDGMAALTKLQICFKADPKDLATLSVLGRAFDQIGQPKKALEVLKEAARIAHEKKDAETLKTVLATLAERAPDDPAVRQLAQLAAGPESAAAVVGSDEVEILSDADLVAEAEISVFEDSISEVFDLTRQEAPASVPPEPAPAPAAPLDAVTELIRRAERERVAGRIDAAVALLEQGLAETAGSAQLRHKLSDVLLEKGDLAGCFMQKLALARQYAEAADVAAALGVLDEILLLQPDHAEAANMRAALDGTAAPLPATAGIDELQLDAMPGSYDPYAAGALGGFSEPPPLSLDKPFAGLASAPAFPSAPPVPPPLPSAQPLHPSAPPALASAPPPAAAAAPFDRPSRMQIDEEAIELAELFAEQGRFDEAQAILNEQLLRTPNHPLVLEQLADLEAARQAMEPAPASPAAGAPPGYPPAPGPVSRPRGAAPAHHRVSGADAATHYDLGVAYHEMGLHAEAMAELELAARDPERECVSLSMMGVIHLGLGDVDNALEALVRAMTSERKTPEQRLALGYELGGAYEVKGLHDQARECFTWLAQQAPSYDDPRGSVAERLARLRPGQSGAVRRPETLGEGPPSSRDGIDGFRRGG